MSKGTINVSVENIFPLIKKFLYSDQEIFLRELISNATDATLKLKHLTNIGEAKVEYGNPLIEVKVDKKGKKTILELNLKTFEYQATSRYKYSTISKAKQTDDIKKRMKILFEGTHGTDTYDGSNSETLAAHLEDVVQALTDTDGITMSAVTVAAFDL